MLASLERTVVLLYHRHVEHVVLDVTVLRAEAGLERAGLARSVPSRSKGSARRSRSPSRFAPTDAERVFEKSIVVRCGGGIAGPPRLRWATGFLP